MNLDLNHRLAGVLVPIFALRGQGDLGIGDTVSLMEFIDWAADVGFGIVKILPINETGGDHSPYNAISSRALDPTTIRTTPEHLPDLSDEDYTIALQGIEQSKLGGTVVTYSVVKPLKQSLLEAAFNRFSQEHLPSGNSDRATAFQNFQEEQKEWLPDYTLFRVLLEQNQGERWDKWPEEQRTPEKARSRESEQEGGATKDLLNRQTFFAYVQWIAFTQWRAAKAHAVARDVALMGDIPFGVSFQSADVWAHPELFRQGWCGGTPPDLIFKHDPFVQKWGQNWGIPLYDWDALRAQNFEWWRQRVRGVREFFDLFRIDHVLGFYRIYGFPWTPDRNAEFLPLSMDEALERTAGAKPGFQPRPDDSRENKEANRRDGDEYLGVILEEAGPGRVIGEDLGVVPDYVRPHLTEMGIAGYKIPAWEKRDNGSLIPGGEYERLSLATYGTHDHDTMRANWEQLVAATEKPDGDGARHEMRILGAYAGLPEGDLPQTFTPELQQALLRSLFFSNSWIAVAMITDLFGRSERFNLPGVAGSENWTQRLHATIAELRQEPTLPSLTALLEESGRQLS